jgi:hypothetical protein
MKRIILTAVLLLGATLAAQADTNYYTNVLRQPRGDDQIQADVGYCNEKIGAYQNGTPPTAAYRRCMAGRGWRFDHTRVEKTRAKKTWIDPDTGDTCHEILGGLGSSCGNF